MKKRTNLRLTPMAIMVMSKRVRFCLSWDIISKLNNDSQLKKCKIIKKDLKSYMLKPKANKAAHLTSFILLSDNFEMNFPTLSLETV